MARKTSSRRLAENEVVFRQLNEQVQKGADETNRIASEDNQPEYMIIPKPDDPPLYFYCECSDENCSKRVLINQYDYNKIHKNRDHFTLVTGHEVNSVEKVIFRTPEYSVVEKLKSVPEKVDKLRATDANNA